MSQLAGNPASSRALVSGDRILYNVPAPHLQPWSKRLQVQINERLVGCLDCCWFPGRGAIAAYQQIQPDWEFCDIRSCFGSIDHHRLWKAVRLVCPQLLAELQRFIALTVDHPDDGLPEGTPVSSALVNVYLNRVDRRWAGKAVRYGDNWATSNRPQLRKELLDLGLVAADRATFTERGPEERPRAVQECW